MRELTKTEEISKRQIRELLKAEVEYQTRIRELEQQIIDTESFFGRQAREYQQKVLSQSSLSCEILIRKESDGGFLPADFGLGSL